MSSKKARYYRWVTQPDSIQSDLKHYRACVEELEGRLRGVTKAGEVWAAGVERARLEMADLHSALQHKSALLEKDGEALLRVLCDELGVVEQTETSQSDESAPIPPSIPPNMVALCTERALGKLGEAYSRRTAMLVAAAAKEQSSTSPQVFVYVPTASRSRKSSCSGGEEGQGGEEGDAEMKCELVAERVSDHSDHDDIGKSKP